MQPKQTRRYAKRSALVLALLGLVASSEAHAVGTPVTVPAGSLIIPMQSTFQDPCGLVSAYGLVYEMLAANNAANGFAAHGGHSITIHWAINPNKSSPNRCVPTNLHASPGTPAGCAAAGAPWTNVACKGVAPYQDRNAVRNWNDGCDFSVTNNAGVPVTLIKNSTGAEVTPFNTINTTVNPGLRLSYPNYRAVTVKQTGVKTTDVTSVQYLGGAFIVEARDAQVFLDALDNKISGLGDANGNTLTFSQYTTGAGTCATGIDSNGALVFTTPYGGTNSNYIANEHYVNIHKAKAPFTAYYGRDMSDTPGKIALLVSAGGQFGPDTNGSAVNGLKSDMLPAYLKSAGLGGFAGAYGCPTGGYNALKVPANCPKQANGGSTGIIYDQFDVFDLQDSAPDGTSAGPLSNQFGGARVYQNLWVPHWEGTTFSAGARTCDNTCINTARATIRGFTTNQPVGVLAECGSIGVIEGTADVGGDPTAGWWYPPVPGTGDPDGGYPNATVASPPGQLAEQIATCTLDTTTDAGGCLYTATSPIRGTRHEMNTGGFIDGTTPLRNCTDPNLTSGNCVYYDHPQDPYSQTGDQSWYPRGGLLSDYQPNTNATYNSSWTPLAFAVANVNQNPSGDLVTPATRDDYRAQAVADLYSNTISPLSNSAYSSSIVYLGGHSYASDVAGSRVVLNTMLAIGARTNPLETAVASATAYGANLYSATYFAIPPGQNIPFQENHFTPSLGSLFQFPFHHGDIQGHGIFGGANQLGEGSNGFDVAAGGLSAQSALPATNQAAAYKTIDARNIFTYLGGTITSTAGNGGAQTGWSPVDMDYPSVLTSSNCLDVMRIGEVNSISKPNYTGTPYAGMLLQRDGVCDLQEALALTPVPLGVDHGTVEGIPGGLIAAAFNAGSEVINAEELVQIVRGYCYATVGKKDGSGAFQPRPTFCNLGHNLRKLSLPILGGFVHSQPAIIPASQLVTDTPAGKHRPTVMYAGGLDGMLHAFYVPSDGGDAGYSGPGGGLKFPSSCVTAPCDANSVFHTKYNAAFSIPSTPLTELWAFIPPGQLPYLKSNSAEVDSSPAVVDVFGDFGNTGVREWHTVLVASAGGSNREIFALDVTNPLKPVMLWDIQPNYEDAAPASLQYAPVWLADDDTGSSISITGGSTSAQAFAWVNSCRDPSDAACKTANFVLPPAADPGRTTTGLFNYQHVGASQGVSAAALRRNNAPLFAAFLATNEPQNQENSGEGLYTFAIDLVNGHKVWEFRNSYNKDDIANPQSALGNNPPDGVTLLSKAGNSLIDTAYVGDDHGSLWELDAADGINNTSYANSLTACTGGACNFALSQAYGTGANLAQPISTLSTVFVVPSDYPSSGPLKNYINQAMLAYGTAGTDTVTALEPIDCIAGSSDKLCITGQLHLLPIAPTGRYSATQIAAAAPTRTAVKNFGDAIEVPGYPIPLATGDRLFGSIVVAGSNLIFATNSASKTSSIDNFQGNTGATYQFKLGDIQSGGVTPFGSGSLYAVNTGAGGAGSTPLVVYDNPAAPTQAAILTVTNLGIAAHYINAPGKTFKGPGVNGQNQTPATFLGWFFRRRGSEY